MGDTRTSKIAYFIVVVDEKVTAACDELSVPSVRADCVSGPSAYHVTTNTNPLAHIQVEDKSTAIPTQQKGNGRHGGSSDVTNMDACNANHAEGITCVCGLF